MSSLKISGQIVDVVSREIYPGTIHIENGRIAKIVREVSDSTAYLMPGFIDAHIHIESSMLPPSEFARLAVQHGTVGTVSDPHEIGNVLGVEGVRLMIENGKKVPFHFCFGAPSCVPATPFETAGASITKEDIRTLFVEHNLKYLSEMMNYPGVLNRDPLVMDKIQAAKDLGLPIDGHAPGLKGALAKKYIDAGISTDHECFELEEALDKLKFGMKILIREGSAAKNFEALHPIIASHPDKTMFCSDDKHPHELVKGHINELVKRALALGYDFFDVLRCATLNPIVHYKLPIGLLQEGDSADFIIVNNLTDFQVKEVYIKGDLVKITPVETPRANRFNAAKKQLEDFFLLKIKPLHVIEAYDGSLITGHLLVEDPDRLGDLLKIAVVNRYSNEKPALAFVKGFGLQRGAIASSVAHDCHNIIAVGASDKELCAAVNAVIEERGGLALVDGDEVLTLPLGLGGIMSERPGEEVAKLYEHLDKKAKELGSPLSAPFMTLSFMALLVIPKLKLSDRGLFDSETMQFIEA